MYATPARFFETTDLLTFQYLLARCDSGIGLLAQVLLHTHLGDVAVGPQFLVIPGTLAGIEAPVTALSVQAGFRFGLGAQ